MAKTCVLITGTPYSGKSIPAGVLHHMGVYFGDFCLQPDKIYNRHDYFEHPKFTDMNADISKSRNIIGMYNAVTNIFENKKTFGYDGFAQGTIRTILNWNIERGKYVVGIKDPRLCFPNFAKEFSNLASEFYDDIRIIICTRSLSSLIKEHRENLPKKINDQKIDDQKIRLYVERWKQLTRATHYKFKYWQKIQVDFDDFIYNPERMCDLLSSFVGVNATENSKLFLEKRLENMKKNGN